MFVDGRSIRVRFHDPNAPEDAPFDPDYREKYTRPVSREAVMNFVAHYAARQWAGNATATTGQIRRRLQRGARVPIRPAEVPDGTSFEWAVEKARILLEGCFYCGAPSSVREIQTDHVIPKSRGGTDHNRNLVAACRPCNSAKYDRTYEGFRAEMARQYDTEPPKFFGETDEGQRLLWFTFDPDDPPRERQGRPIQDPDRDRNRTRAEAGTE